MKHALSAIATAFAVSVVPAASQAGPMLYFTTLSGPAENPPNSSPGTGFARVTYDPVAHTLRIESGFSGLVAPTSAAHIHCCVDAPGNVGVAVTSHSSLPGFPLGVMSGTFDGTFDLTQASSYRTAFINNAVFGGGGTVAGAEAALVAGLEGGDAYFNIHTSLLDTQGVQRGFPNGEIRGFLQRVPEPGTLSLLALGLGLGVLGLRRANV